MHSGNSDALVDDVASILSVAKYDRHLGNCWGESYTRKTK